MSAMCPGGAILVELSLPSQNFTTFECRQALTLSINMRELANALQFCSSDKTVSIIAKRNENHITLQFVDAKYGKTSGEKIDLINVDQEQVKSPVDRVTFVS